MRYRLASAAQNFNLERWRKYDWLSVLDSPLPVISNRSGLVICEPRSRLHDYEIRGRHHVRDAYVPRLVLASVRDASANVPGDDEHEQRHKSVADPLLDEHGYHSIRSFP